MNGPYLSLTSISSAGDWTPVYYTVLYYTCIIPYETFYTNGRSDCMYWTPYGTQNLWNKFNIISDPIQCVAIKTAVVFFEKLPKSTILTVINPYQSPNKSPHDRIRNNQGTIGTKTCKNGTYYLAISRKTRHAVFIATHCNQEVHCYGNQLWATVSSWHITCIMLAYNR